MTNNDLRQHCETSVHALRSDSAMSPQEVDAWHIKDHGVRSISNDHRHKTAPAREQS